MMITRRGEIGIASALIIISQTIASQYNTGKLSEDIAHFKEEFQQSLVDQEHFFARKTDLNPILIKIDGVSAQIIQLNKEVSSLKTFLKDKDGYDTAEISCHIMEFSHDAG